MKLRAHWYRGKRGRNYGDALTAVLFARLADIELVWSPPSSAQLFGAGSIAHRIPAGYTGAIFGTGYMWAAQNGRLGAANVLAVRGALTAAQGHLVAPGRPQPLLADPGILAAHLLPRRPKRFHRTAVVPHYADTELAGRFRGHHVNILWPVERVVAEVASCSSVVTSSLHALVLADALGIESRWEPSAAVIGHGHKFADYASAYGKELQPHTWRMADQAQVQAKAEQLLDAMRSLR